MDHACIPALPAVRMLLLATTIPKQRSIISHVSIPVAPTQLHAISTQMQVAMTPRVYIPAAQI
jgi:hypothetical protein